MRGKGKQGVSKGGSQLAPGLWKGDHLQEGV